MVARLYKMEKQDSGKKKVHEIYEDRSEFIKPGLMSN